MSPQDEENTNEYSHLLSPRVAALSGRRGSRRLNGDHLEDADSIISSHLSKEELALGSTAIGERLPYNDYTTIDWLHDLVTSTDFHRSESHLTNTDQRLLPLPRFARQRWNQRTSACILGCLPRMGCCCNDRSLYCYSSFPCGRR